MNQEELIIRELICVELKDLLMNHQRDGIHPCICGTAKLGASHSDHVIAIWRSQWPTNAEEPK